jgi:hypothetical protein
MNKTRYLEGLPARATAVGMGARSKPHKVLGLWVLLIVMFLAIWQFLSPKEGSTPAARRPPPVEAPESPYAPLESAGIALAIYTGLGAWIYFGQRKRLFPDPDPLVDAETALLSESFDDATDKARAVIAAAESAPLRAQAVILLARVATMRGELTDAEQLASHAIRELGALTGLHRDQMVPLFRARRAFALAGLGRTSEAEAELAQTTHPDAFPGTQPLAALARAVLMARLGQDQALLQHVAEVTGLVRRTLTLRERVLLRTLAAHAKMNLEPATRAAGHDASLDPDIRAWITLVAPEVTRTLGAS